jgi:hypothetical protein
MLGPHFVPKCGVDQFVLQSPPSLPSLPIVGSRERFPVHRIYCMGLNNAEHFKRKRDV